MAPHRGVRSQQENKAMNRIALMICCVPLMVGMNAIAEAQTTDMSKFTCEQLLQGSGNSVEAAIWLSGYYNGQKKNTKVDASQFKENAGVVVAQCKENPKATVMQTISTLMSRKK
jgi:HdeA/HdeB family